MQYLNELTADDLQSYTKIWLDSLNLAILLELLDLGFYSQNIQDKTKIKLSLKGFRFKLTVVYFCYLLV